MPKIWSIRVYTNGDQNREHRPCRHYAHVRHALEYVRKLPGNVPIYVELLECKCAVVDTSATLYAHSAAEWLQGNTQGVYAKLQNADPKKADLSGADLSGADLSGADLSGADLRAADPESEGKE